MSTIAKYVLLLVVGSLPVVLMFVLPNHEPAALVQTSTPDSEVIHFAKHIMLQSIRSPETAVFGDDNQFVVQSLSNNQWRVKGHVDYDNALDSRVRMPWSIVIRNEGKRWVLVDREHVKSRITEIVTENSWTKPHEK